jgi:hypothetical protein
MHAGTTDPRELGRLSGKRRREPNPERVPASLRAELQKLDPAIVRGAIERALAGDNESARVSAVKLLADVDAFRQGGECPVCAEREAEAEAHGEKSREMILRLILGRAEHLVGDVLLEFEHSLEDGALMRDVRRRLLDALDAVNERVDHAGRVHSTAEAARRRDESAREERARPVKIFH